MTQGGGKVWTTNQGCIGIVSVARARAPGHENGTTSWLKILDPSELSSGNYTNSRVVARDPVEQLLCTFR